MATIGTISAIFSASTAGLTSGISRASTAFRDLASDVSSLRSSMNLLIFTQVANAASSAASSLIKFGAEEAGVIDATRNLSIRLGMTYGEFAGIAYAADLADVSMESVGNAAQKAEVAFAKAAGGSSVATAAFASLGLSVADLQAMNPAQRFQAIAGALQGVQDPAERARLAVTLFGKSGAQLLPMFEGGAAGIAEAAAEAERFGLTLNNQQATAVDNMGDAFQKASKAISGVVQQVVAYLAPALESVTTTFTNLVGSVGGANIGQFIGEGILMGAEFLAGVADSFIVQLTQVWEFVSSIGAQWSDVFALGNRVAAFFSGVGDVIKFAFAGGILGISSVVTTFAKIGKYIAELAGYKFQFVDDLIVSADAFNSSIVSSMDQAATDAAKNFGRAFGEGAPAAAAQKGPLATMIADAAKAARENMKTKDGPTQPIVKPPGSDQAFTGKSTEAIKAIDSRSKEGMTEMFRLMRGGGQDVQAEQLEVQKQIRDSLAEPEIEQYGVFPGA
jgi:hypothetical protein